ncbi:DUF2147 domain-containing protein [Histidinibacterium aquaticum]|uniref:Uncharacterized protein n=1 Tax=Histidinibacterium aquaticum TaxID=2613962 RepID=A0A5J5GP28_9RHOB|nr:hypothetical protein [Histidinibacterium aquaticum]KAA9009483.1 hypothetical protein F3S47_09595 [Histidinibacterium aquaticum]
MKRILVTTCAALVAGATSLAADSYFTIIDRQDHRGIMELGTVVSDHDGVVEIYESGKLIGKARVKAGTNRNVRVNAPPRRAAHATAVLRAGDKVLDEAPIRIARR